jgi:hypothetical protein
VSWAFLIGSAPFIRYLFGTVLIDTRGSILIIGLMHASFNSAGSMSAAPGGWQYAVGMVVLTLGVAGYRRLRGRSTVYDPASRPQADEPIERSQPAQVTTALAAHGG